MATLDYQLGQELRMTPGIFQLLPGYPMALPAACRTTFVCIEVFNRGKPNACADLYRGLRQRDDRRRGDGRNYPGLIMGWPLMECGREAVRISRPLRISLAVIRTGRLSSSTLRF